MPSVPKWSKVWNWMMIETERKSVMEMEWDNGTKTINDLCENELEMGAGM